MTGKPWRRIGLLLVVASLFFSPVAVSAQEAEEPGAAYEALTADAVSELVPEDDGGVLVVAAGKSAQEAAPAASGLRNALIESGVELVMDAESLGDVTGNDDATIISNAANLPVSRFVIVRAYPAGDVVTIVATVYGKTGEPIGSLTFKKSGETSTWKEARPRLTHAMLSALKIRTQRALVEAREKIETEEKRRRISQTLQRQAELEALEDEFDERKFVISDEPDSYVTLQRANGEDALRDADVYEFFDEPRLASEFVENVDYQDTLFWIGSMTMAVGTLTFMGGFTWFALSQSAGDGPVITMGTGGGLIMLGVIPMAWGSFYDPNPLEWDELEERVRRRNRDMREEMGLPPASGEERSTSAVIAPLRLGFAW